MRILYIHQYFALPSEPGGSRPYEFARRLVADGHQVVMLCAGAKKLTTTIDGIKVVRLKVAYDNSMGFVRRVLSFLLFSAKSSLFARRLRPNLVYASSTPLTVAIPALFATWMRKAELVFEVRDLWPEVPIRLGLLRNPLLIRLSKALERRVYLRSVLVVALSESMKSGVLKVHPTANTIVVPNGSDLETFDLYRPYRESIRKDLGWIDGRQVLVYAGGFGYLYGLEWAVRLAAAVKPWARVILIGEGSQSHELKSLAEELKLNPREMFLGKRPKHEVAKLLVASDTIISSLKDNPSIVADSLNKIFDAFGAGRPLVFNHGGPLVEMIREKGAGWRLSNNPAEAALQLHNIFNRPGEVDDAAARARSIGEDTFSRDGLYLKLINAIEGVTGT